MIRASFAILTIAIGVTSAAAQHHHETSAPAAQEKRTGDAYPLATCPVTGKTLGAMGALPAVKIVDGREVRFCCPSCLDKFQKDKAAGFAAIDEKIIRDQLPLYPLKTSVVTGKDLPAKPYDYVYGNRLFRLGSESEKAEIVKDPAKHQQALDKAVIAEQGAHYPLTKCAVSGEAFGGEMGPPKDVVLAGRLIRLCCPSCMKELEKDPPMVLSLVDAARAKAGRHDHGHDHKDGEH